MKSTKTHWVVALTGLRHVPVSCNSCLLDGKGQQMPNDDTTILCFHNKSDCPLRTVAIPRSIVNAKQK